MESKLDYSRLTTLCLLIASKMPKIPDDPREATHITRNIDKIDDQGDGFKSFAGIILGLLLSKDRVILLDEPEAFLHPTQAKYLGKWIADHIENFSGQLIISTHNSNFLSGLLAGSNHVDIYRLNRIGNETSFNKLPADVTAQLSKDPLLSSQRVLDAIFHKGAVVCEADADRSVYGSVAAIEHQNQDILFLHAHNKQTIEKVVGLLRAASVPAIGLADIDLINDEGDLSKLYKSVTGIEVPVAIKQLRIEIASSVENISEEDILKNLRENIAEYLDQLNNNEHSLGGAKGALNRISKSITKWSEAKKKGVDGFEEKIRPLVIDLIERCEKEGLFILPVGELEAWITLPSGVSKKNKWIIPALQTIHDGNTPESLSAYVKRLLDYFKK